MRLQALRISYTPFAPLRCSLRIGGSWESSQQEKGLAKGFPVGNLQRLLGVTLSSNEGGGKPGFKFFNEKCTSDLGTLKHGALGLEG